MGNNQPRYFSNEKAIEIIGGNTWLRLRKQLERTRGKIVDFSVFYRIVLSKFELMPKILVECLYRAFALDVNNKIEVNDFITSLAVISSQDRPLVLKFLFNFYDIKVVTGLFNIQQSIFQLL